MGPLGAVCFSRRRNLKKLVAEKICVTPSNVCARLSKRAVRGRFLMRAARKLRRFYRWANDPVADALLLAVHWSRVNDGLKKAGDVSGK